MNIKPKQIDYFVHLARLAASQSTCVRLRVGAVLVREGRVISTGWNGVPPGERHCNDYPWRNQEKSDGKNAPHVWMQYLNKTGVLCDIRHADWSRDNEIHAEANCIASAARFGVSTDGASMVVTTEPCVPCSLLLIAAGIQEVVYDQPYDRSEGAGTAKLRNNNVSVTYAERKK